ncbi:MAG: antibiotic biosynthesis monooxygenase [Pseudomonadota bacterium]
MIAVIFELIPKPSKTDAYFDIAAALRPSLEIMDGFISVERFQSLTEPGKYLSLSFWRDENAVTEWRNQTVHRGAQSQGRSDIFRDYRLRVAHVARDYGLVQRNQAPADSIEAH